MRLSSEILFSGSRIQERVEALSAAIAVDTPDRTTLSVLALLDGAFMFCSDLVRMLPMPVQIGLVPVRSVLRGGDPSGIVFPHDFPIEGTDLLVLEDILDTGRTLGPLRARLEQCRPLRIRIAVLLDKPARREVSVRPDYVGFVAPDRWLVGYGLDWNGLYRNLPYISYVE